MIGYVEALKPELRIRDYSIYNGYYCGLCKTIGKKYGQAARPALSYDMTFLALLIGSFEKEADQVAAEHCALHHIEKKPVIRNSAVGYAADMTMILGYESELDDIRDGEKREIKDRMITPFLKKASASAEKAHPGQVKDIRQALSDLSFLQETNSGDLDRTSQCFADVMKSLFLGYDKAPYSDFIATENGKRIVSAFAESLGRWIYLADALDDYEEDIKEDRYNPFRFIPEGTDLPVETVRDKADDLLYKHLAETAGAFELLPVRRNRAILENIIYLGLRKKTDDIIEGKKEKQHGSTRSI